MTKTIDVDQFIKYHVTGVTTDGKRFKRRYDSPIHAFGINLWRGSVWGIRRDNGKRKLLKAVWN